MTIANETAFMDATAQAELVRKKEVTPLELIEAAIARIERLNPELNSVVTPMFDLARETATGELPDGPFRGVPFLLKDILAAYAGVKLSMGSRILQNFVPPFDSELVARLKRAGLVILGRTNSPEFGLLPTTEPEVYGPCRNPWNTDHTPGGSSGGAAAAVASGMVAMAHANDGGGSIRIPASCCGVFGLKPTRGRNPLGPFFGDVINGLVAEHAVTRSVRDSAALLDATGGPDLGDPYWAPPPARPFAHEVGVDPGRLRIAMTTSVAGIKSVHPDCIQAVQDAASLCEELGHRVQEAAPKLDAERLSELFTVMWSSDCAATLQTLGARKDQVEALTWALGEQGGRYRATEYVQAVQKLQRISRAIARFFTEYDIWLTPTLAEPPVPLGTFKSSKDNPLEGFERSAEFVPITPICNMTGQPAMSVPLFWNSDGLPVGSHFVARFGDEATLFRLAAQLEQAQPWAQRRPPVAA